MASNKYGWRPGVKDNRDFELKYTWNPFRTFPKLVDRRQELPPAWDQGQLGSCSAYASLIGWWYCKQLQITGGKDHNNKIFIPSFLFQYYNTRVIQNTVAIDSGASIGDAYKSMWKYGVCEGVLCPYDITKFADRPPQDAYTEAQDFQMLNYYRVPQTLYGLKSALADKQLVTFGMAIYESFEDPNGVAKTGVMVAPRRGETMLGGHAICLVGFDDIRRQFIVRNSWSPDFGHGGYFVASYDIILSKAMCDEFFSPKIVE